MTSQWASWRLKSPASPLSLQPFVVVHIKQNIKAPPLTFVTEIHRWPVTWKMFHLMTSSWFVHTVPAMLCFYILFGSQFCPYTLTLAQLLLPIYQDLTTLIQRNKAYRNRVSTYPMKLRVKDKILCSKLCKLIANYLVIYVGNICLKSDLIFMEENISLKLKNL